MQQAVREMKDDAIYDQSTFIQFEHIFMWNKILIFCLVNIKLDAQVSLLAVRRMDWSGRRWLFADVGWWGSFWKTLKKTSNKKIDQAIQKLITHRGAGLHPLWQQGRVLVRLAGEGIRQAARVLPGLGRRKPLWRSCRLHRRGEDQEGKQPNIKLQGERADHSGERSQGEAFPWRGSQSRTLPEGMNSSLWDITLKTLAWWHRWVARCPTTPWSAAPCGLAEERSLSRGPSSAW